MRKYSAIIADDEENLCSHLESLLKRLWPELQIIGSARNGSEALSLIRQEEPDIAFLDIKMPVMNGVNVAMHSHGLCHVVFITAYDEYAIQAFEHDALDYVLKPVTDDRLIKTIKKLKERLVLKELKQPDWADIVSKLLSSIDQTEPVNDLQWIRAGKDDKTILIPVDEILFFKSGDKYTSVVTSNGKYLIRKPIKELNAVLNENQFWKINRGIIINVNFVSSIVRKINGSCEVHLKESNEILIASRKYSHLFKQM